MKSAQLSGVSWVVVVQRSATLSSVYQHRDCGNSAMEREVSYYINIGRDSARAEQSAKDWAVEVRQREAIDQTATRWSGRERVRDELSNMWQCVCVSESGNMCVCVWGGGLYVCVRAPQSSQWAWMWGGIQRGALWSQSLIASSQGGRWLPPSHTHAAVSCTFSNSQHTLVCRPTLFACTQLRLCTAEVKFPEPNVVSSKH